MIFIILKNLDSKAELMYWYTSFRVSNVIKMYLCVWLTLFLGKQFYLVFFLIVQLYTVYNKSKLLSFTETELRLWILTDFYSIAVFRTVTKQFVSKNKNKNDKLSILIILKYPFVLKLYIMFNQNQVWLNDWIAFRHIGKWLDSIYAISAIFQPYIGKYD